MNKKFFLISFGVFLFFLSSFYIPNSLAEDEHGKKLDELNRKIKEYEEKIESLQGQQKTLFSTISYLDEKINLTTARISATEHKLKRLKKDILILSGKINILDRSITDVTEILTLRIETTYKEDRLDSLSMLLRSKGFANFIRRVEYLKSAQRYDKTFLYQMQEAKMSYDAQKSLKEKKQQEQKELQDDLVKQQNTLDMQKASKQKLLSVTQNDEKKYQQLLAATRAEIEAIQSIIAGLGEESKVGDIGKGQRIASVISGVSTCSTGTHLHFEIVVNGAHNNPISYLKSRDVAWDLCGWFGCDDPFAFTGSWDWPLDGSIRVTQGYGMTAYARSGAYGGNAHTGIDMVSDNSAVKAVKDGILYRGSIPCGGGTLRYVKVEHKDSNENTYYLHINY